MTAVTGEQALALMAEAVAEMGEDHTVGVCSYFFDDGQPNCIVGRVLAKLGVTREDLTVGDRAWMPEDHEQVVNMANTSGWGPTRQDKVEFTEWAHTVLKEAQEVQDGGHPMHRPTWGTALKVARFELTDLQKSGKVES